MDIERIAESLGLERARVKGEELSACCPFHDDRSPSFSINMETGAWICYAGCGSGGLWKLVSRMRGIGQKAAKDYLKKAGIPSAVRPGGRNFKKAMAEWREKREHGEKPKQRPCPPYDITRVPPWVLERGFSEEILKEYQCGYSPFYDALVIPVLQSRALIYRFNPGRGGPKYKFTKGFKSHNTLFGLGNVTLGLDGSLILVEGPLDVLWLRQHGYGNSLAILGGGRLGREQGRIIREDLKPKKLILAFDNDEGGQATTEKSLVTLRGIDCYVVQWEDMEYQDEDEEEITIVPNDVAELDEAQLTELLRAAKLTALPPRKASETSRTARTLKTLQTTGKTSG